MSEPITLHPYQGEAVGSLESEFRFNREFGLFSPTGSGKSLMIRTLVAKLQPQIKLALVIVPQIQIESGYVTQILDGEGNVIPRSSVSMVVRDPWDVSGNVETVGGWIQVGRTVLLRDSAKRDSFRSVLRYGSDWLHVTTHAAFIEWQDELLEDLSGCLLIVDEAHHLRSGSELDTLRKTWVANGGQALLVTATPLDLELEGFCYIRPLSEHMSTGQYAPENIEVEFQHCQAMTVDLYQQVQSASVSDKDLDLMCEEVVQRWVDEGCPHTVVTVPGNGGSRLWATGLVKSFQHRIQELGLDIEVFNAVQGDDESINRLQKKAYQNLLDQERRIAKGPGYTASRCRIIIACKRMDEGTDWPFASLLLNIGLPQQFVLIMQRLGRLLRLKQRIQDYPNEWVNRSKMVFMVPPDLFSEEEFNAHTRDHLFMVGFLMSRMEEGSSILQVLRNRWEDKGRRRSGWGAEYKAMVQRLMSETGLTQEQTRRAYAQAQQAVLIIRDKLGKPKLSGKDLSKELLEETLEDMGLSEAEITNCMIAVRVRADAGPVMDAFLSRWDASTTRKLNQRPSGDRIILDEVLSLWEEVIHEDEFDQLLADTEFVEGQVIQFTGMTSEILGQRLASRLRRPWEEMVTLIAERAQKLGHTLFSPRDFAMGGPDVYRFIQDVRAKYKSNQLSRSLKKALEDIPEWVWSRSKETIRLLTLFANEHGHTHVPENYCRFGFPLGKKVAKLRAQGHSFWGSRLLGKELENNVPHWSW